MDFILPILLTMVGLIAMLYAYSGIKRGGSLVYTLEREALLQRAIMAMFGGTALLVLTIGWLLYQGQPAVTEPLAEAPPATAAAGQTTINENGGGPTTPQAPGASGEPAPAATNQLPALSTVPATPTVDPNIPTPTPTPVVVRAFVTGTSGTGLTLRQTPGGEQVAILNEDEVVTVLEEEGQQEQNGFTWVKVRTFLGDEGWAATEYLEFENR